MGILICKRCTATARAPTQKEADDLIDHGLGKMIGRPCDGKESDLMWTSGGDSPVAKTTTIEVESPDEKPKFKKPKRR